MRRMFSEKQLASIVAEVLSKNENIEWVESLKDYIEYDTDNNVVSINSEVTINDSGLDIPTPSDLYFYDEDKTLGDLLDEKQDKNPTDLSGIVNTFGDNPIQHQLPAEDKSNLTTEEENQIWNNMLYWIKKGYVRDGNLIIKLGMYYIEESSLTIFASCAIYDSGAADEYEQRKARIDKTNHEYVFLSESV